MSETTEPRYSYYSIFGGSAPDGEWRIADLSKRGPDNDWQGEVVFRHPFAKADWGSDEPPLPVRMEYERLIGYVPGTEEAEPVNIVELMAIDDNEGGGFTQPCAYGHLVAGHSVYCHNTSWLYAPRKCKRTWYTGGRVRDEDCTGFKPNPVAPTP